MELHEIVETSRRVAASAGRRDKIELLADCLARCEPPWVEAAVGALSGRRARAGSALAMPPCARRKVRLRRPRRRLRSRISTARLIGWSRSAARAPAPNEPDCCTSCLPAPRPRSRISWLRLLLGELRQGALEGLMMEAVARASGLPPDEVRRAVMMAGDIGDGRTSRARRRAGRVGPVRGPAVPADQADARPARRRCRRCARHARSRRVRVQARWRTHPGAQGRRRGARVQPPPQRGDRGGAGDRRSGARRCPCAKRFWTARRSRCAPTAGRSRFRSPCGASAASSTSPRCATSLPLQSFFFDVLGAGRPAVDRPPGRGAQRRARVRRCRSTCASRAS